MYQKQLSFATPFRARRLPPRFVLRAALVASPARPAPSAIRTGAIRFSFSSIK
jgi:hypothetical protein